MFRVLNVTDDKTHCGNIGHVIKDFELMCKLAQKYGFHGVNLDMSHEDHYSPMDKKLILEKYNLTPVAFGFSAEIFNANEQIYQASLEKFISEVKDASTIGTNLALYYIPPFSNDLNFNDRFILASSRLKQLHPIIHNYNLKIGFEFIGPTETRKNTKYDFIHTIDGTRALIASAELYGHAGYKLDIHHWQFSGATTLDLEHMDLEYIFYIELNDSLSGYSPDDIPEFERELPGTTGNTDISSFLKILANKGYNGPIAIEPWNKVINTMPLEDAIKEIKLSMDKCELYIK